MKSINIKLTKSEVARIAQQLAIFKHNNMRVMTPLRDYVDAITDNGNSPDTNETRERFFRVARLMGWCVCKRNGSVFENGIRIWSTVGD